MGHDPLNYVESVLFDLIKRIVAHDTLSTYPYFNETFQTHTDASAFQLGAVISQKGKPIVFYSRKLLVPNPAWASGPSETIRYFTCSGSPDQDRGFESLRNFRKGRDKCLGSRAVANSHAAG